MHAVTIRDSQLHVSSVTIFCARHQSVTGHFQTSTENAYLRETTNMVLRRCSFSVRDLGAVMQVSSK